MPLFPKSRPLSAALIAAILVLIFVPLALRPLFNLNEGLYAEAAREMLAHNPLIPRLDGMPYLEKPPIFYWLIMLSYKVFGIGKFAARLPSAISALATIAMVARFARDRVTPALWPPLLLLSSAGFYMMSQLAMFDMTFTFFHTIALLAFFSYIERPARVSRLWLAAAASALACLTKGLIGIVLPGLIVITFLAWERKTLPWRPFLVAWLVFFVIVLPWHIWMTLHVPHFFDRYIIQEHFDRFLGTLKPMDYRRPPLYYNLEHILIGVFPWTPFLIDALIERRPYDRLDRFLLVWAGVYLVFFTVSKTSSSYYMLPIMPALALFVGRAMGQRKGRAFLWIAGSFAALCLAGAGVAFVLPHPAMRPYVAAASLLYFGFFVAVLRSGRGPTAPTLGILAVGALSGFSALFLTFSLIHPNRYASQDLARALLPHLTPSSYVFVARQYEDLSSLDFYLNRPIYVFDPHQGDLYYGIRHDSAVHRLIRGAALRRLARTQRVFIVGPVSARAGWNRYGRFRVIASNGRDVAVENIRPAQRDPVARPKPTRASRSPAYSARPSHPDQGRRHARPQLR